MVLLLEIGIAAHSIIIGIALGIESGSEFTTLLVALSFHQFFEGLALSTVVAEAKFKRPFAAIFTVIFYSLTTPLGIAIGIAIRQSCMFFYTLLSPIFCYF